MALAEIDRLLIGSFILRLCGRRDSLSKRERSWKAVVCRWKSFRLTDHLMNASVFFSSSSLSPPRNGKRSGGWSCLSCISHLDYGNGHDLAMCAHKQTRKRALKHDWYIGPSMSFLIYYCPTLCTSAVSLNSLIADLPWVGFGQTHSRSSILHLLLI